jgi:prepilin-type processing-associated H-X9-DG protein
MKEIGAALGAYAQDWDEQFPPAAQWYDGTRTHLSQSDTEGADVFRCPAAESRASYGFNAALAEESMAVVDEPAVTAMLFEADASSRSFSGGMPDVAWSRHYYQTSNVVFADGHARSITTKPRWADIQWRPKQPDSPGAATATPQTGTVHP